MDNLVQEILDNVGEYLILRGYITKADKDLLETLKKLRAQKSEMDIKNKQAGAELCQAQHSLSLDLDTN